MVASDDALKSGDLVGQAGIEKIYNALLMGEDGAKRVVVNSVGREIRTLDEEPPTEGQAAAAHDRLRRAEGGRGRLPRERGGAPDQCGRRWCPRSPNRRSARVHERARVRPERVCGGHRSRHVGVAHQRRAAAAERPRDPGALLAGIDLQDGGRAGGLEEGVITPDFQVHCTGGATYGRTFKCWKKGGHGTIDLRHAIEQSCDVYFYTVGNMVGVDKINKWATLLGLGVKSGIDLPNEVTGLVPSTEWKREKMHEKWYAGETISVAIGQGAGLGDAGVDGGLHGDARQRRHASRRTW